MELATKQRQEKITMKQQLWDIIVEVSWGEISEQYFKKSRSWLSKKMNGKGFNGEEGDFTPRDFHDNVPKLLFHRYFFLPLFCC